MKFIKETNIDDYADQLQTKLQHEYEIVCYMLETCKKGMKDHSLLTGVDEYRARKYEVEHIAQMLGFDLDDKGMTTI